MPEWAYSAGIGLRNYYQDSIPEWSVLIGASTEFQPHYDGSSRYGFLSGPALDIRYRDIAFLSLGEGLGVNLLRDRNYRGGIALTYDLGREVSRRSARRGLDSIDPAPEVKAFFEYVWLASAIPVTLRANVRHAIGGYDGLVADLNAYLPLTGSQQFVFFVGPSVTFADANYMQSFFGISHEQAARSHRPEYNASAGFKSISLGSNATWFMTENWLLNGQAAVVELLGDAADSPTTERITQYSLSFTVGYQF
jgi:outer membrane scaffolding protein for murein synthesis (MipA/OmpV family)